MVPDALNFERYLAQQSNRIHGPKWQGTIDEVFRSRALNRFLLNVMFVLRETIERSCQ
jgi:hypothetical protein